MFADLLLCYLPTLKGLGQLLSYVCVASSYLDVLIAAYKPARSCSLSAFILRLIASVYCERCLIKATQLYAVNMPSRVWSVVIVALLSPISVAPFQTGFSVQQVVKNTTFPSSGPLSLLNTYIKYGVEPLGHVKRAALTGQGSVTATPTEYDSEFLSPVEITAASGGTTYVILLDTGSSEFTLYAPKYGSPNAVVTKTVDIGGAVVTNQAIKLSSDSSGNSDEVGLSYQGNTFYVNAVEQGLPKAVYTVNFKNGKPGNINFGYIDASEYTGTITYATVNTANGFWEFTSNGYAIGAAKFVSLSIDAVVDTGTSLLLLPNSIIKAYYAQVSGSENSAEEGGYIFPCAATLPSLTLGIGTYRAVVPGDYLNYAPVNSTYCFGGAQSNTGIGFSIFGISFITSQFVVFQGTTNPTIGFATKPT